MKNIDNPLVKRLTEHTFLLLPEEKESIEITNTDETIEIKKSRLFQMAEQIEIYEQIIESLSINDTGLFDNQTDLDSILASMSDTTQLSVYHNLDKYFRSMDVRNYIEDNPDEIPENIELDQSDYDEIAENFLDNYDCNLTFNNQLEYAVKNYINPMY